MTFDDFVSEYIHYNLNICGRKGVVCIGNWMDCAIISLGQFFGPHGYLSFNEFKAKFLNVKTDFLLYEGILTSIKPYKRRLGLEVKEDFVIADASVWKYLYKASVKDLYTRLVKNSDTPKCTEKWNTIFYISTICKTTMKPSLHIKSVVLDLGTVPEQLH